MKIGILGYGKEGRSAEQYFQKQSAEIQVFDNFTYDEIKNHDFSGFDLVLRSPSLHPQEGWSSMTEYFFEHCPCPIIGVTGTKGKGTTCSLITDLLKKLGQKVWLVGNIGNPALEALDDLKIDDVVVYEMSSFQLWDLHKSPHISVVLRIEPDHLNVHDSYDDYVNAKANIAKYQTAEDTCVYFAPNADSSKIAAQSAGTKLAYPLPNTPELAQVLSQLAIPGQHNQENAEAALLAVSSYFGESIDDFITKNRMEIITTFQNFQGLPHRLQFLRELNGVKYYDDNFSTTPASLAVAIQAFPRDQVVLIMGGRDKTDNQDFPEIIKLLQENHNLAKIIFMGESGRALYQILCEKMPGKVQQAKTLPEAVEFASTAAEELAQPSKNANAKNTIVLMSPAAASFDMFENVYARGAQYQKLIQELQ